MSEHHITQVTYEVREKYFKELLDFGVITQTQFDEVLSQLKSQVRDYQDGKPVLEEKACPQLDSDSVKALHGFWAEVCISKMVILIAISHSYSTRALEI